ncbi:MAG: DMT family transporter [Oscillospiraceae bacterium]|nr:DMT family transporter [Oscillospiraceae bacterium]
MKKYDIAILAAGVFWGVIGLFTRQLEAVGVPSSGVLIVRSSGCGILFVLCALCKDPRLLKIRWKDAWLFFCFGILSTLFFTYCYYQSIALSSLSAACTLMYSAPVFVMVISLFVFHERFTRRKLAALLCAVVGCCLVSGILEGDSQLSTAGVIYGLLAGIGYAFYSICSKSLSNRGYHVLTINAYGWCLCAVGGLILWGVGPAAPVFENGRNMLTGLGLIVISGFLPALLYSWGLQSEEAGKGAVMASVEPVVASILGFVVFGETPTVLGLIGIILVLGAVVVLNTGHQEPQGEAEKAGPLAGHVGIR